jgi:hypothetical protein
MLGPVMTCMRCFGPRRVSLAMKLPPLVSASRASTTGWRPAVMSMQGSRTNCGAHQSSVSARSASAHRASSVARARRQLGQRGHMGLQLVQHLFVQPLLARQGALLRAQGLVFKGLELGRDEALGVFQRLAAAVVVGHLVHLALRHLDVEAVHLVELHAQVGNAGAGALARFQVQQKRVAVVWMARSSSSSASKPVAITPPSRTSAAGSSVDGARQQFGAQPPGGAAMA